MEECSTDLATNESVPVALARAAATRAAPTSRKSHSAAEPVSARNASEGRTLAECEPRTVTVAKIAASIRSVACEPVRCKRQCNCNAMVTPAVPRLHFHSFTPRRHFAEPVKSGLQSQFDCLESCYLKGVLERVLSARMPRDRHADIEQELPEVSRLLARAATLDIAEGFLDGPRRSVGLGLRELRTLPG